MRLHIRSRMAAVLLATILLGVLAAVASTVVAQLAGASFATQHGAGQVTASKEPGYIAIVF